MKLKNIVAVLFLTASCTFCYSQKDSSVTRVYFEFGKFSLSESALQELNKLVPEKARVGKIKITGQTDQVGTNPFNDRLSLNRANEVYNYLIKKGLSTSLASEISGSGKRNLIVGDGRSKEEEGQLNRVVVITSYFTKQEVENKATKSQNNLNPTPQKEERKPAEVPQKSFEQQLKEGSSTIVLDNLNFVGGRHVLLPTALPALANILETMKKYPTLEVEIQGHICCTDPGEVDGVDLDTNERVLSTNRAKAVFEYLVANGISAGRMTYKGFGSKNRLVFPETNESDFSRNRRVEFKITKQ